jgi:hypothetical protein
MTTKAKNIRIFLGFLIAPIIFGLMMAIGDFFIKNSGGLWILQMSALAGYPMAIVFGVPAYCFFEARNYRNFLWYILVGVVYGLILFYIFFYRSEVFLSDFPNSFFDISRWSNLLVCMFFSTLSTVTFWLIARPDLAAKRRQLVQGANL